MFTFTSGRIYRMASREQKYVYIITSWTHQVGHMTTGVTTGNCLAYFPTLHEASWVRSPPLQKSHSVHSESPLVHINTRRLWVLGTLRGKERGRENRMVGRGERGRERERYNFLVLPPKLFQSKAGLPREGGVKKHFICETTGGIRTWDSWSTVNGFNHLATSHLNKCLRQWRQLIQILALWSTIYMYIHVYNIYTHICM